jgi:hypothetical protein
VNGTLVWLALLGLSILVELRARLGAGRTPTLGRVGAAIATSLGGRILLLLLWMFAGLHLFSRYTLPGH